MRRATMRRARTVELFYDYDTSLSHKKWGTASPSRRRSLDEPMTRQQRSVDYSTVGSMRASTFFGTPVLRTGQANVEDVGTHPSTAQNRQPVFRASALDGFNRKLEELRSIIRLLEPEADGTPPTLESARHWLADALEAGEVQWTASEVDGILKAADVAVDPVDPMRLDSAHFLRQCRAELVASSAGAAASAASAAEGASRNDQRLRRARSAGVLRTSRDRPARPCSGGALVGGRRRAASASVAGASRRQALKETGEDGFPRWSTLHKASSSDRLSMYGPTGGQLPLAMAPVPRPLPLHVPQHYTEPRSKRETFSAALTLRYRGPRARTAPRFKFVQHRPQQAALTVFDGTLRPGEPFSLHLRRSAGDPLGLTVFKDGLLFERYSACCENKYRSGGTLGGASGSFVVLGCDSSNACRNCGRHQGIPSPGALSQSSRPQSAPAKPASGSGHTTHVPAADGTSASVNLPQAIRGLAASKLEDQPRKGATAGSLSGSPPVSPNVALETVEAPAASSTRIRPHSAPRDVGRKGKRAIPPAHGESFDEMWQRLHRHELKVTGPKSPDILEHNSMYAWGLASQAELSEIISGGDDFRTSSPTLESREDMLRRSFKEAKRRTVALVSESSDSDTTDATSADLSVDGRYNVVDSPHDMHANTGSSWSGLPPRSGRNRNAPVGGTISEVPEEDSEYDSDRYDSVASPEDVTFVASHGADVPMATDMVRGDPQMEMLLTKLRNDVESRIQQEPDVRAEIGTADVERVAVAAQGSADAFLSEFSSDED